MATINVPDEGRRIDGIDQIQEFLGQFGIWYRYFDGIDGLPQDASSEAVLDLFAEPIKALMAEGGYVSADVIHITPELDGLETMLNKFNREHYHTENEVRFIVDGRGVFHVHPKGGPVFSIEVAKGDLINVPEGTYHWFDLCEERSIRAVRLFQDTAGWTPHYTDSQLEAKYLPLCFGPAYLPPITAGG